MLTPALIVALDAKTLPINRPLLKLKACSPVPKFHNTWLGSECPSLLGKELVPPS